MYCLLSRSRMLADMPESTDWEAFMDATKLTQIKKVSSHNLLKNYAFGSELCCSNTCDLVDFRNRSCEFVDRLVDVILGHHGKFLSGVHCFDPEFLLEGDDQHIFQLYSQQLRVLRREWLSIPWRQLDKYGGNYYLCR